MEWLIEMRESDANLSAEKRRNRTLSLTDFESICNKAGSVSDNGQLLRFPHNAGIIFWREGLFEDRIVLDQAWVLDAIYTVFNCEKCLQQLRTRPGRFTRIELGWMVWDERYSPEEQNLFVSCMRSCGIYFEISKGSSNAESTYIGPDLLPENWSQAERWGEEPAQHERSFSYESLLLALLRNLICRIGESAGIRCDYWRNGFYGFESEGERFLKRVRVYTEEDALVWTMEGRADYAVHWKVAHGKINSMVKSHGINVLGDQDKLLFGLMEKFAIEIGDMLGALTDVLQPRSLNELVTYSFDDEDFDDA